MKQLSDHIIANPEAPPMKPSSLNTDSFALKKKKNKRIKKTESQEWKVARSIVIAMILCLMLLAPQLVEAIRALDPNILNDHLLVVAEGWNKLVSYTGITKPVETIQTHIHHWSTINWNELGCKFNHFNGTLTDTVSSCLDISNSVDAYEQDELNYHEFIDEEKLEGLKDLNFEQEEFIQTENG